MNNLMPHQPKHNRNVLATLPLPGRVGKPSVEDIYPRIFDAILEQRIAPASRFTEESLGTCSASAAASFAASWRACPTSKW